jgi:hypothetical protein
VTALDKKGEAIRVFYYTVETIDDFQDYKSVRRAKRRLLSTGTVEIPVEQRWLERVATWLFLRVLEVLQVVLVPVLQINCLDAKTRHTRKQRT